MTVYRLVNKCNEEGKVYFEFGHYKWDGYGACMCSIAAIVRGYAPSNPQRVTINV